MTTQWQLAIDCADPARLAEFWTLALGYEPAPPPAGWATWDEWFVAMGVPDDERADGTTIADPAGVRPSLCFHRVPEPKAGKNRLHVDVQVGGGRAKPHDERWARVSAAMQRLTAAGASVVELYELQGRPDHYLMADPEGNEFCLV
jgi:hypothetical protein